jgi:hypothetical protein
MNITNMLNSRGSAADAAAVERQYQQHMAQASYPSPSHLQQPMAMLPTNYHDRPFENVYMPQRHDDEQQPVGIDDDNTRRHGSNGAIKAFACATCGKGFARRSDLARHGKTIPYSL